MINCKCFYSFLYDYSPVNSVLFIKQPRWRGNALSKIILKIFNIQIKL